MPPEIQELERRIVDGAAELPSSVRRSAASGSHTANALVDRFVRTVRERAYTLTDDDVCELGRAGMTDTEIFELTVAAAFGAARLRLVRALAVLEEARAEPARLDGGRA